MKKNILKYLIDFIYSIIYNFSILKAFIIIGLITLLTNSLNAQNFVTGSSEQGTIAPLLPRPLLELKVLHTKEDNMSIYPGIVKSFDLVIINNGNRVAEDCEIIFKNDSGSLNLVNADFPVFSVFPGDTIRKTLIVEFSREAHLGWHLLSIIINETNGFNLFPERNVNFFVKKTPELEVIVSDYAIKDQRGVGYIEQFEEAELIFRIQNCSFETFENIKAKIIPHPTVIERQINPNYHIGTLEPGEFKDIVAVVSTNMMSSNIEVDVNIEYNNKNHKQGFLFEFREDYKYAEDLSEEGCLNFISQTADLANPEQKDTINYEPKQLTNNKFAVIIPIMYYFNADSLKSVKSDANIFIDFLRNHMGYSRENISIILNPMFKDFNTLETHNFLTEAQRRWRRAKGNKELTFYYLGNGSVDSFNGDYYILPSDFNARLSTKRININDIYTTLNNWKKKYDFQKVNAYFNIYHHEKSATGQILDHHFSYIDFQKGISEITSFMARSHKQESIISEESQESLFNKLIIKGLNGFADYDQNGKITSFELYRFLSDEFQGVPHHMWNEYQIMNTPLFFGQDTIIY